LTIPNRRRWIKYRKRRETFDAAIGARASASEQDYQVPFVFNSTINKLTFNLGPMKLSEEEKMKAQKGVGVRSDAAGHTELQ
jgi:hypothetical protein